MTSKGSARRAAVRFGRPPKGLAEAVEKRILEAARKVFLDRGFQGASIEEIAEAARSDKPTIYARFPGKEALFTAVVTQSVAANIALIQASRPTGATIEERFENLGAAILQWILVSDAVGLMRVAIAEARRFPGLASSVFGMAREHAAEGFARLLAETAHSNELGKLPASPEEFGNNDAVLPDVVLFPRCCERCLARSSSSCLRRLSHVTRSAAFFQQDARPVHAEHDRIADRSRAC